MNCCSKLSNYCAVSSHRRAKISAHHSPTSVFIDDAILKKATIWVKYEGGSAPGTARPICPTAWKIPNMSFTAIDVRSGQEHKYKYYVDRVSRYSDETF